mmetsp:Transcript_2290/g.5278  ORF Transcript_2290/g.5278 Transcript_2290/m.5278 type:complete len:210 (+) Transcript_2290:629-1258(+)
MTNPTAEMIRMNNTHTMTRVWRARRVANSIPTMSSRHECMNLRMLLRASFSDETDDNPSPATWSSASSMSPSFSRTAARVCSLVAALMSLITVSVKCAYERITETECGNFSMSQRYSDFAFSSATSKSVTHLTMSSITAIDGRPYAVDPDFSVFSTRCQNFFMSDRQFWCDLRAIDILESNSMRFTALRDPPSPRLELTESWVARRMTA